MNANHAMTVFPVKAFPGAVLIISFLCSVFFFFDGRKSDYKIVFQSYTAGSFQRILETNNDFYDVRMVAEKFDRGHNTVFVTGIDQKSVGFIWVRFQIDYFFYPARPETITFNTNDDVNQIVLERTIPGDVIVSFEDIGLLPELFTISKSNNHVMYIRK